MNARGERELLEGFEQRLGSTRDPDGPFAASRIVADDEAERFPQERCDAIIAAGCAEFFVPAEHGGRFDSLERCLGIFRALARRDLTATIAVAQSFLAATPVWIAGAPALRKRMAERVLGGEGMSLALTEEDHGSDLLASSVVAEPTSSGFRLQGQKWMINNASRASGWTVFARTREHGGPRGFSLLAVERPAPGSSTVETLPKHPTLGVRGADISGVRFRGLVVPEDAVIGRVGDGVELSLKTLQLSRILCAGFALGTAETLLRLTVAFARERRLYGKRVIDLPLTRTMLADCFADLLLCECCAHVAARLVHVAPGQTSAASCVAKYIVPTICEEITRTCSVILGSRFYSRSAYADGLFQKLVRDGMVISLFDGSTTVNLAALASLLRRISHAAKPGSKSDDPADFRLLGATRRLPLDELQIAARELDPSIERFLAGDPATRLPVARRLAATGRQLAAAARDIPRATPESLDPQSFQLARRYSLLHAAADAQAIYDAGGLGRFGGSDAWLDAALHRVEARIAGDGTAAAPHRETLLQELIELCDAHRSLSLTRLALS